MRSNQIHSALNSHPSSVDSDFTLPQSDDALDPGAWLLLDKSQTITSSLSTISDLAVGNPPAPLGASVGASSTNSFANPNSPTTIYKYAGSIFFENTGNDFIDANAMNGMRTLAETGANTIDLWFNMFQQTTSSNILNNYPEEGTTAALGAAIDYAHSLGMQVALKPTIAPLDGNAGGGSVIDPADPASWFAGYKQEILKYAEIAQQHHVELFTIGTELTQLDRQPQFLPYWTDLISAVRQVYTGELTYAAATPSTSNWGSPNGIAQFLPDKVSFWNQLDYIGVDAYPTLAAAPQTVTDVVNGWNSDAYGNDWIALLHSLNTTFGKPVMLSEMGFASYTTSYLSPISGVPANAQPDDLQQELLLDGTYQALASSLTPAQFAGVTQWVEGAYPTDNSSAAEINTPTGMGVFGKPSQWLMSSLYGAKDYMGWSDSSFTGSIANDQINMFGDQIAGAKTAAAAGPVTRSATFGTVISVTADSDIINGQTATIHLYVNGVDYGAVTLQPAASGFVDSAGVSGTSDQTFTFTIQGLTNINQLKIAFDSSVNVGGPENLSAFISAINVNGVALTQDTCFPLLGSPLSQTIDGHNADGTSSLFDGGYMLVDASPWNAALSNSSNIGTLSDPIQVDGGGGHDALTVLGASSQYTVTSSSSGSIALSESSGLNQNASVKNVEFLQFSDKTIFIENADNANIARLYSAAFNRTPDIAGLSFWEDVYANSVPASAKAAGYYTALAQTNDGSGTSIAANFMQSSEFTSTYGSLTDAAFVTLLYQNVLGRAPDQAGLNFWVGELEGANPVSRATALVGFAESPENVAKTSIWLITT